MVTKRAERAEREAVEAASEASARAAELKRELERTKEVRIAVNMVKKVEPKFRDLALPDRSSKEAT